MFGTFVTVAGLALVIDGLARGDFFDASLGLLLAVFGTMTAVASVRGLRRG